MFDNLTITGNLVSVTSVNNVTQKIPKTTTKAIIINGGSVHAVPQGLKTIFPSVMVLIINRSRLVIVSRKSLMKLKWINFSENQIEELPINSFWECPDLHRLILDSNKIKILDENLFIHSQSLVTFEANYNQVRFLHRELFRNNLMLREVSLIGNQLRFIEVDFFSIKSIAKVSLNENSCINISIGVETPTANTQLSFQQEIAMHCLP